MQLVTSRQCVDLNLFKISYQANTGICSLALLASGLLDLTPVKLVIAFPITQNHLRRIRRFSTHMLSFYILMQYRPTSCC